MVGFDATAPKDLPFDLIADVGGVILFKRNIQSAAQLRDLVQAIRSVPTAKGVPVLVAIDQEGASVSRLSGFATTMPSAMALGAAGDPSLTESMYRLTGDELAALGISVNFAPVADVNNNPRNPVIGLRSFGDDPGAVAMHVQAAVRGLQAAGVAATAKHFPGHGDTTVDSHFDLPRIDHSPDRMQAVELVPFQAAIAQNVELIMTAHVLFPALEQSNIPATLSRAILNDLLRNDLGFKGIICTDCMEMSAIADNFEPDQAAEQALRSGADLVLFSHTPDKVRAVQRALRVAIQQGKLVGDDIAASLQRLGTLRARLAESKSVSVSLDIVGSQEHKAAALAAARRATTVVRDPQQLLPLALAPSENILVVQFAGATSPVEDRPQSDATAKVHRDRYQTEIGRALAQSSARIHEQVKSLDPAGLEYKQLLTAAGSANTVFVVASRAVHHPMQARAIADLAMIGKRVIAIASREPYDADVLPPEVTVIASYGADVDAMQAAAGVILGAYPATGKLPVTLSTPQSTMR